MNQILSTSMPVDNNQKQKNKTGKAIGIKSIIKFFGVVTIIFGIFLIGLGTYSMVQKQSDSKNENVEPTISIDNKTENTIILKVTHKNNIDRVEYGWNDGEKVVLHGNNGKYLEKEISVPSGKNTLHILVVDEDGKESTYDKEYELESKINLEIVGNKIKITYSGDTTISYMTYRWDEEEEKKVEIQDKNISQEIDVLKGLHTLTVIVVDENNNTDTKVQKINGVSKPKVEVRVDDQREHFIIIASDDDKISKFSFRLNQDDNQTYKMDIDDMNYKEIYYILPDNLKLQPGENKIEVTVYNSSGISAETGLLNYEKE